MSEAIQRFRALSEEFVEIAFHHHPVAATRVGIHDYDHELPNDSPEGLAERVAWLRDFERRLAAQVPVSLLPPAMRIDRALLGTKIAALTSNQERIRDHARNPVRYPETALQGIFLLLARPFASLEERKESILARLMAVPDYLEAARANFEQVPAEFVGIASEVSFTGPMFVDQVVRALLRNFAGEAERIEHAGARARLGFLRYQEFLERDLAPRVTGSFGIGETEMNLKLTHEHLLEVDCRGLEELGLMHIDRTERRLEEEARRIDPARSWQEQLDEALRRGPEPSRLLETYAAEAARARRFVADHRLAPIPEGSLEIVETPVFQRSMIPYATYVPAAPFDHDQTGYFFVTPIDPARKAPSQPMFGAHSFAELPLIVLHEAYPGRHLQVLHANLAGSRVRQLANSDLFAEGWALYCEELMFAQGFFSQPVTRLIQLRDLLWRACRVVLDVRLQTGRMSFGEAVDFLVVRVMLDRLLAESEIKRYILRPTQPLSYLVGNLHLLEIREEAERRLGSRFCLHDFHQALLGIGTLPPALVKEELWERIGVV